MYEEEQIVTISDPYYDDIERFEDERQNGYGSEKEEKLRNENPEIC